MKNIFCFGISCLVLMLVLGCTITNVKTSIVPHVYTNNTNTAFEILGEVIYESSERVGYIELLRAARNQYPDCHYVIDIMVDQRITTITTTTIFFSPRSQSTDTSVIWVMRGTAIKYNKIEKFDPLGSSVPVRAGVPAGSPSTANEAEGYTGGVLALRRAPSVTTANEAEGYSVQKVTGIVQRVSEGTFVEVKVGDVLTKDTTVRLALRSSLVLTDGSTAITIPAGQNGKRGKIADIMKGRDISRAPQVSD